MKYDVVILGAGINGCAVAREISATGKKVAIIDKSTIGSGTSSKSSRLIHGGLRYLEHGDLSLVKEALFDRTRLCKHYPDLVHLTPFILPVYKHYGRPWWIIKIGLYLYDLFSHFIAPHYQLDLSAYERMFPLMNPHKLDRVYLYYDARTNDLSLTQRIANEAKQNGADFFESTQIDKIARTCNHYQIQTANDTFTSPILINTTGPWIDEVNHRFGLPSRYTIDKVSGIHIVIPRLLCNDPLFLQTDHKRIFFVLPDTDSNITIIGTTERLEHSPTDSVMVNEDEINYLISEINRFLITPLSRDHVCESYIGVRPLVHEKKNMNKTSREYQLEVHDIDNTRLIHVFGGKLTTHWSLAEKVVKLLPI